MTFLSKVFPQSCGVTLFRDGLLVDDQHKMLARFLPWLYLMVVVQQVIAGISLFDREVHFLWTLTFISLTFFSVTRAYYWWCGKEKFKTYSQVQKRKDIVLVAIMAPVLGIFFSCLSGYLIYSTSDLNQVFVGMSIVTIATAGALSLYVVPVAAISLLLGVYAPIATAFLLSTDDRLVTLGMVLFAIMFFSQFLIAQNFLSFSDLVCSRSRLEKETLASKRSAQSVERLAFYDALTDLPNRRKFVDQLSDLQRKVDCGEEKGIAVGVLDVVGFKSIEDVYGRDTSDTLLRQVASRLMAKNEKHYQGRGLVARLSDNKFVFLAPEIENVEHAQTLGGVLCKALSVDFDVLDDQLALAFSCGVALYPYSDSNPDQLIARADMARRKSANGNSNSIGVFSLSMELSNLRKTRVEHALRDAVEKDLIEPWFQPIVRISDGSIVGFEALARWHDKSLGIVGPDEFIEIAEQSQLIEKLTLNMFRRTLEVAKTWSPETKLFFNLSPKVLTRQYSIDKMLVILESSGVPASRLDIELTETAVMQDIELAKVKMQKLKDAGIGIALDDFGSGYSSLGQIRDLPLDKVKIDKSFTDQICSDEKIRKIVQAVIQLCNQLEISVVVEGIEDLEQVGLLADMDCEYGQGYLFSKPIPSEKTARRVLLTNAA